LIHEIVTANPSANKIAIIKTGIAQSISQVNGRPKIALITRKTTIVGRNLKIAIITAETGNIIRGNEVLRMSRCPAVIDLTPPTSEFEIR